jgi:hypothetical protein
VKGPWLTVLDHRFIDRNVTNCRHIDGSFGLSTPPPQVIRETFPDGVIAYHGRFYDSWPGSWLQFTLATPLNEVIGAEVRVKIRQDDRFPARGVVYFVFGGNWMLAVRNGQLEASLDNIRTSWPGYPNIPGEWFDIRWSWRLTGQSILTFNGEMVAVRPDVSPGRTHNLAYLVLGSIPTESFPGFLFRGDIAHFRVSVLTRERAEKALDAAAPISPAGSERLEPCREEINARVRALIQLFRGLMQSIISQQTKAWVREDGGSPITRDGTRLHKLAQQAAGAMVQYMTTGNDKALEDFRSHLDQFLKLLARLADRQLISELGEQVDNILREFPISEECRKAAEEVRSTDLDNFKRLEALVDVVIDTVRDALGVHWDG